MNKMTGRIREFAKERGVFDYKALFEELKPRSTPEKKVIRAVVHHLVKRGELSKVSHGIHKFEKEVPASKRKPDKRKKVWAAMRALKKFTKKDIATIAGCSLDYVSEICGFLRRKEHIEVVGTKGKKKEWVYMVAKDSLKLPEGYKEAQSEKLKAQSEKLKAQSKDLEKIKKVGARLCELLKEFKDNSNYFAKLQVEADLLTAYIFKRLMEKKRESEKVRGR